MDPPPFAKKELVQEFYANFSQAPGDIIYVRGVNVDIQAARWREFLGLQPASSSYEDELKNRYPQRIGGLVVAIEENICEMSCSGTTNRASQSASHLIASRINGRAGSNGFAATSCQQLIAMW